MFCVRLQIWDQILPNNMLCNKIGDILSPLEDDDGAAGCGQISHLRYLNS